MMAITYFSRQVAFLVVRRQLNSELSAQSQTLLRLKNVLGANIHPFEQNCLPSNSIPKLYKSTKASKGNLDENFTPRRFTPEDDQKLLEHVKLYGKSKDSLQRVGVVLDRTYNSVVARCHKLLSSNACDLHTEPKNGNWMRTTNWWNTSLVLRKLKHAIFLPYQM